MLSVRTFNAAVEAARRSAREISPSAETSALHDLLWVANPPAATEKPPDCEARTFGGPK
jgi:hypothetical protein